MNDARYSRQSFLGEKAHERIRNCRVGIVGLGGGGSHIVLQTAHIGFLDFILCDKDVTEESNLNRNVGATLQDAKERRPKVEVASRIIRSLSPDAAVSALQSRWQDADASLKGCDIIFGCVDSFEERSQLEAFARRHLIPYIDIGMDVHQSSDPFPVMAGQIILSLPGGLCMRCIGYITDEKLTHEASRYGVAGPRPQVVWPNGVLASTAVGVAVDLLTDWAGQRRDVIFLSYYANEGTIGVHPRLEYLVGQCCPHYPLQAVGAPAFRRL